MNNVIDKEIDITDCSKIIKNNRSEFTPNNKIDIAKEASLEDGYVQYWLSQSCEED